MKNNVISRRSFIRNAGTVVFLIPISQTNLFGNILDNNFQQDYHFSQPSVPPPSVILNPNESQLSGFKAVAWHTPTSGIVSQTNYVEANITTNSSLFQNSPSNIVTVQFAQWWGRGNGIKVWDGTKYGYDVNNVKASFGAMIKIPENTGTAIGYATFYLRGEQVNRPSGPDNSYWIQVSVFDERGYNSGNQDNVYYDSQLTSEAAIETQINQSSYSNKNPDSNTLKSTPFSDFKFFGATISRQQLYNLMTAFNSKGANFSPEPNLHRIFGFGVTPELGLGQNGGSMKMGVKNLFLRTEY